jgi:hypothetical protein
MGPIMNANKLKIGKKNSLIITVAIAVFIALTSIPLVKKMWNKLSFINPEMFE